jgi:hypothetical protein
MFTLDRVVPWGRSFDEYRLMFALSDAELGLRILGCGDGPAAFNAEATRRGARVVSCDPLYRFGGGEIRARVLQVYDEVLDQTRRNAGEFVWDMIRSVEELGQLRRSAMNEFLADYEAGKAAGRYIDAELPRLALPSDSFDLALCSHFLFLYTEQLGEVFHLESALELCRVADEVRIFPLLALGARPSPYVDAVAQRCLENGHQVTIEKVPYEFQRGGDNMMRIRREV